MLLKDCKPGDYVLLNGLKHDRKICATVICQDDRKEDGVDDTLLEWNSDTLLGWKNGEMYANNSMGVSAFITPKTRELLRKFNCLRGLWVYNKIEAEKLYSVYCIQDGCFCCFGDLGRNVIIKEQTNDSDNSRI